MWTLIAFLSIGLFLFLGVIVAALQVATARLTDECDGEAHWQQHHGRGRGMWGSK